MLILVILVCIFYTTRYYQQQILPEAGKNLQIIILYSRDRMVLVLDMSESNVKQTL